MIGILTFFQYYNYGTFLQAYALQNHLLKKGYDNELIDYRTKTNIQNELQAVLKDDGKNPILYARILWKIVKFKLYHRKLKTTEHFYTREELSKKHYDAVVIGSDQIWCYTKEWAGLETPYFSDYLNADKIIAYAASMGPDKFDQPHPRSVQRLMKNFSHIATRDNNTFKFAKLFNPHEPTMVLDPTLLYDFKEECKEVSLRNYILVYSDVLTPSDEVIQRVKKIARERNLKIVSIGKEYSWCDSAIISASPFKWLGYIKNADFVFTCMFHGLLFSIKFNKQFAMFLIPERENKCLDFLNRVELKNRVITSGESFDEAFNTPIDYSPVNEFLERERAISENFLDTALSSIKKN